METYTRLHISLYFFFLVRLRAKSCAIYVSQRPLVWVACRNFPRKTFSFYKNIYGKKFSLELFVFWTGSTGGRQNGETRVKKVPHGTTFFGRFRVDASDYIVQQYYYDYICRIIGTTETGDDLSSKISA